MTTESISITARARRTAPAFGIVCLLARALASLRAKAAAAQLGPTPERELGRRTGART